MPLDQAPPREYATTTIRGGTGGLYLGAIDTVPEGDWTRLTNARWTREGGWTSRPGMTSVTDAIGTNHHSIARLNNPSAGTWTRVWGIDTSLYMGQSGALTLTEAGFSGDPLTMVEGRPPFSGETWMYIADRTKMRKVRSDGLDLPIGLPAPAAPTTALAAELSVTIEDFESGFNAFNGTGGALTLSYPAGKSNNCLQMACVPGAATGAYWQYADKGIGPLDLTTFGAGVAATSEDFIHIWIKVDRPDVLDEVRVYLISGTFTSGSANIPGTNANNNTTAFVKAFRPNDITRVIETVTRFVPAGAETVVTGDVVGGAVAAGETSFELNVGRGAWTEFGVLLMSLRRSDFLQIGDGVWSDIRGIAVHVKTTTNTAVTVSLDQMFMRGGRGPDAVGGSAYDYRLTHYDTRTGVEGNPSPVQAESLWLSPLRRAITITPAGAYGDAAVRQRAYRRGGGAATADQWHFVGQAATDGGAITDTATDDATVTEAELEIDNDQPVTTVNTSGATVLAQAIPVLFGPDDGYMFGLGSPYEPGHLYWSKRDNFDSWPATNKWEVCSPSEELLTGFVYGNQAYCWSRRRLHAIYPDQGVDGRVVTTPTACTRGLLTRWSGCVGPDGLYGLDATGVYRTTGDVPEDITGEDIRPLFRGITANGYTPIDFTVPKAIRLAFFDDELWVVYQNTGGSRDAVIYNRRTKKWRHYDFAISPSAIAVEEFGTGQQLLLGGVDTGRSYTHSGTSDGGTAITVTLRSQSARNPDARADLQLGDLYALVDRQSTTITVTPYLNWEASSLAAVSVTAGSGMARTILDPFGTTPQQARTVALEIGWSSAAQLPVFYEAGVSWIRQPVTTKTRPTDWHDLGTAAAKFLKGVSLDVDTGNVAKTVVVEYTLDGGAVTTASTLTVTANGRRHLTFAWAGVYATQFRLRPTDSNEWQVFDYSWLIDTDVLGRTRIESQPSDYGDPRDKVPLWLDLVLRCASDVTVTLVVLNQAGGSLSQNATITAPGATLVPRRVRFTAAKGQILQVTLTATTPIWVAPRQTFLTLQPWQGDPAVTELVPLPDLAPSVPVSA